MQTRLERTSRGRLLVLTSVFRPMARVVRLRRRLPGPPRAIGAGSVLVGFAGVIAIGTALLSLPTARTPGSPFDLLTALFTASSAACAAGLVVVDTGTHWSTFGQAVILGLVQVGGFGVMTAAMFILVVFGRPVSLKDRLTVRDAAGLPRLRTVTTLIVATAVFALATEAVGAAALFIQIGLSGDAWHGAWQSGFLAVSAFNNAGLDALGGFSSLAAFGVRPLVLVTVSALAVIGGLGTIIVLDLAVARSFRRLSLGSKMVLLGTVVLLAAGFAGFLGAESGHALAGLSWPDKAAGALFYSAMSRSAGFATVDIGQTREQTQLLTVALMYVGGATGGTAGGIKVGTLAVLALATLAAIRGHDTIRVFGWEVPHGVVYRALGVATLYMALILSGTLVLTITETAPFREVLFETVSAVGTVGLTTGITPELSAGGRLSVIVLMVAGRLGPLALMQFLLRGAREPAYRLPEGRLAIG